MCKFEYLKQQYIDTMIQVSFDKKYNVVCDKTCYKHKSHEIVCCKSTKTKLFTILFIIINHTVQV